MLGGQERAGEQRMVGWRLVSARVVVAQPNSCNNVPCARSTPRPPLSAAAGLILRDRLPHRPPVQVSTGSVLDRALQTLDHREDSNLAHLLGLHALVARDQSEEYLRLTRL